MSDGSLTLGSSLTGIALWDGDTARGPSSIRWAGDRIEAIEAAEPAHDELAVIPGLIDTHVHLDTSVLDGSGPGDAWPLVTPPEEQALHVAAHTLRYAEHGVTTIRDLAASPIQMAVARALDQGVLVGGRLLAYGPVGMTAGHGDLFTPPRYRVRPPVADSPDECRRLVRTWAREGAHGIKIYTSGGILSMGDKVGWRNQTLAELSATVDEAHALGMLVAAHSHTAEGIDIALDLGVDSIEHATGLSAAHLERLLETDTPIAPTLLINDLIASGSLGVREEAVEKARAVIGQRDPAFAAAAAVGVRFVLGTDANGRFVRHGDQLDEVRRMQELLGWTPARALVAATSDAARAIGRPDLGRIAPGAAADFVVLRGRPWEDIAALTPANIVAVVSRGRLIAGALPQ
jgi:imidazolonepropionase-like amidohydrolase